MSAITKIGTLPHGFKVGEETHKEFEIREPSTADLLDAESDADATKPLNFGAALLARQLVRIGTFEGPFAIALVRRLHRKDFAALMAAQRELDAQGEGEQHG